MRFKLRFCLALFIILTVGMIISYADETEQQNHNTINETQFSTQANDEQTSNQVAEDSNEVRSEPIALAQTNQWIETSGQKFYVDADGNYVKGIYEVDNVIYYFDTESGALVKSAAWRIWNGKRYFTNSEGIAYRNQFISFGPYKFYMGADGAVMTGIYATIDGSMYYADDTGEVIRKAQWITQNGKRYFCDNTGELYVNMLISFGPYRYYMGKDGAAMTGVFKAPNNHSYNADETGELIRKAQWIEQNGKRYFSNEDGEIYTNQFLYFGATKYFVGPDGAVRDDINFDGIDFGIRQSPNYNIGRAEKPIDYIVIHHWGHEGQSFSGVVCWLCRMNGDSSAHYVVQGGRVECIVNPNDTAWHAGNWNYNLRTIGIECRPEMTDGDFDTTARLIANLWKMYGKKPIIGHRDIIPTACPGKYYTRFAELTQLAETYYNK